MSYQLLLRNHWHTQFERTQATRRYITLVALLLLGLVACQRNKITDGVALSAAPGQPAVGNAMSPPVSRRKQSSQGSYALGIVGYNYTEVGIVDYSVNGTGAFNLGVSNEDAGGGKTVCCFGWAPAEKLPAPVQVEWTRNEKTWCRQTVMLKDPGPAEPTTFEVHFYPDRHIEVAVTDQYSPSRLILKRAGRDFRVGVDVRKELEEAIRLDMTRAECRLGRFPVGE